MDTLLGILIPVVLIAISGHIIWRSTDGFEVAADFLGRKMSHGVKGATLNAVASSMPEFLTTMFFLFYIKDKNEFADSFSGGLGVVAGSAVFNILVIPLAIILFGSIKKAGERFSLNGRVIKRDGLFLIFSNVVFIVVISQVEIKPFHGLVLILMYILYLLLLRSGLGIGEDSFDEEEDYSTEKLRLTFRHFIMLDIRQVLLNGKKLNPRNAWMTLLISTLIMSLGTWMLVKGTELLGAEQYYLGDLELQGLNLPLVFLSVLLASAATSIPDTMISVRDARKGNNDDSISNAIGSNIFDLSFALGLPLLIYTLINGNIIMSDEIRILSVSYWLFMWLITIIVIPVFIFSKRINKYTGIMLAIIYLLFVLYVFEETAGGNHWFRGVAETVIEWVNH